MRRSHPSFFHLRHGLRACHALLAGILHIVMQITLLGSLSLLLNTAQAAGNDEVLPGIIARIKPAIVSIGTYLPTRNPGFQFRGTGFAVGDGTLVATNSHVLSAVLDAEKKEVYSIALPQPGGEALLREASVVARDTEHDLLLLRIQGPALPHLSLGNSDTVREGQVYGFTGFPLGSIIGLFAATHTAMIAAIAPMALPQPTSKQLDPKLINKLRRSVFNVLQLDATAYPGNSGSPVFDRSTGEVVGILNMVLMTSDKDSAVSRPSGIAYAVPINHLRALLEAAPSAP